MLLHQPLSFGGQPRDAGFLQVIGRHLHETRALRRRARSRDARAISDRAICSPARGPAGLGIETSRGIRRPACASGHSEAMNCVKAGVGGMGGRQSTEHGDHRDNERQAGSYQITVVSFLYLTRCGMMEILPQPSHLVLFIVLEIALEPFDMAVAFEGENVGGDAIKEPAVMG